MYRLNHFKHQINLVSSMYWLNINLFKIGSKKNNLPILSDRMNNSLLKLLTLYYMISYEISVRLTAFIKPKYLSLENLTKFR